MNNLLIGCFLLYIPLFFCQDSFLFSVLAILHTENNNTENNNNTDRNFWIT